MVNISNYYQYFLIKELEKQYTMSTLCDIIINGRRMNMSNLLKELRCRKRYTAKLMSEKLGISKPFYCQLENRTRRLSYEMAIKIAAIFKMKPDAIFYNDYTKEKNEEIK